MARNYEPQICLFSNDGRAVVNKISQNLTSNLAATFILFCPSLSRPYFRMITIRRLFAQQSAVLNSKFISSSPVHASSLSQATRSRGVKLARDREASFGKLHARFRHIVEARRSVPIFQLLATGAILRRSHRPVNR